MCEQCEQLKTQRDEARAEIHDWDALVLELTGDEGDNASITVLKHYIEQLKADVSEKEVITSDRNGLMRINEKLRDEIAGIRANAPKCGACAEELFCGSSMYPHTCAIAERDQLRLELEVWKCREPEIMQHKKLYSEVNKWSCDNGFGEDIMGEHPPLFRMLDCIKQLRLELNGLRQDKEMLDEVGRRKLQVTPNELTGGWMVQERNQVLGNIGKGSTVRTAIRAAMNREGEK